MNHLSPIAAVIALGFASSMALAQYSPQPAQDQQQQQNQQQNRQGDLTSQKNQGKPTTDSAPEKTRAIMNQDSRTGNAQMPQQASHQPQFATLDKRHHGYVTKKEVRHDAWLKKNFARCDTDHDGQVSQSEYQSCTRQP